MILLLYALLLGFAVTIRIEKAADFLLGTAGRRRAQDLVVYRTWYHVES